MSKILDWIKTHIWQTVLIGFGLFFLPLIFVHIAYRIPAISPWFASTWEPGVLITYIAGFEAFLGTIYLGTVTVKQNQRTIEMNNRLLKIEETNYRFQRCPSLKIESLDVARGTIENASRNDTKLFWKIDLNFEIDSRDNFLQERLSIFTFNLKNLSGFIITIAVESLQLRSVTHEDRLLLYNTDLLGFRTDECSIAPSDSIRLGFTLFDFDVEDVIVYDASMEIIIQNNLFESFMFSVEFQILCNPPDHMFTVRSERIVPYNKILTKINRHN